ncbi:hypothetical protein JOB18_010419 [Solea senegalensis]|uniref:Uncharacterized protein n=1 Tax=Solea senegalensis TaxID=28829 RepID=A0AAV6RXK9_SOLSE|nr:hypothetical protein JOB18_010419 [Solea senegalensis]
MEAAYERKKDSGLEGSHMTEGSQPPGGFIGRSTPWLLKDPKKKRAMQDLGQEVEQGSFWETSAKNGSRLTPLQPVKRHQAEMPSRYSAAPVLAKIATFS